MLLKGADHLPIEKVSEASTINYVKLGTQREVAVYNEKMA